MRCIRNGESVDEYVNAQIRKLEGLWLNAKKRFDGDEDIASYVRFVIREMKRTNGGVFSKIRIGDFRRWQYSAAGYKFWADNRRKELLRFNRTLLEIKRKLSSSMTFASCTTRRAHGRVISHVEDMKHRINVKIMMLNRLDAEVNLDNISAYETDDENI